MKNTWKKVHELGLIVQIQMLPYYAPMLRELAAEFSDTPVLLDHLALASRGTPEQYEEVIRLSGLPRVHMKVSQLNQNSKPLVRRLFDAYGPERLVWGSFGGNQEAFDRNLAQIEQVFDYASEADRVKIRGGNAMKLFGFTG
jgi:predicted TIM-barrel fold metal-dependent hydrolase